MTSSRRSPVAPDSVGAVVCAVQRGLSLALAAESALVGVAAALLTSAAAVLEGGKPLEPVGAALVAALCAAGAWWLEQVRDRAEVVRELDRRLRHHGALLTAHELEQRPGPRAPLEELVCTRVLARLRFDEAVRALFPPLFVPVAAPVAAGLALLFAVESRPIEPVAPVDFAHLAAGLEQALAMGGIDAGAAGLRGEDEDGSLSRAQAEEVFAALGARRALPYRAEDWTREPEAVRARVAELEAELHELSTRVERTSELGTRLEAARPWLDALRAGLERSAGGSAGLPMAGTAGEAGTGPTGDGTITGSPPGARSSDPATSPSPGARPAPAPLLGTQAGTWWPPEYDGLVSRWVELSRAERSP